MWIVVVVVRMPGGGRPIASARLGLKASAFSYVMIFSGKVYLPHKAASGTELNSIMRGGWLA